MSRRAKKHLEQCVYCGKTTEFIERDHVPPRCIFPKPWPNDFVTVPCCRKCHRATKLDDEYFKCVMVLRDDLKSDSRVAKLQASVTRSLIRGRGAAKRIIDSARRVEVHSPTGIWLGKPLSFEPEVGRVTDVISRTVRGLLYHLKGERVPDTHQVWVVWHDVLMEATQDYSDLIQHLINHAEHSEIHTIGDLFEYKYAVANDEPWTTVWILGFFQRVAFVGMTAREEMLKRAQQKALNQRA